MNKHPILVCYDYGMGGVWAVLLANGPVDVTNKYHWLTTFETRPEWMSEGEYNEIAATQTFDIDEAPRGWLLTASLEHGSRGS